MKKISLLTAILAAGWFLNCASIAKDVVTTTPAMKAEPHRILIRPTESTLDLDEKKWIEGKSYKGKALLGISFFEDRFNSPTLLNKEGYDAYTLDASNDAIEKNKIDAIQIIKAKEEVYAFPFKYLPLYATYQVTVKGHPVKFKFLGPISEQKADELYSAGLVKGSALQVLDVPLFAAKEAKAGCCK